MDEFKNKTNTRVLSGSGRRSVIPYVHWCLDFLDLGVVELGLIVGCPLRFIAQGKGRYRVARFRIGGPQLFLDHMPK